MNFGTKFGFEVYKSGYGQIVLFSQFGFIKERGEGNERIPKMGAEKGKANSERNKSKIEFCWEFAVKSDVIWTEN